MHGLAALAPNWQPLKLDSCHTAGMQNTESSTDNIILIIMQVRVQLVHLYSSSEKRCL